jgi:uncharacterized FAD-dependent dehydrogenase
MVAKRYPTTLLLRAEMERFVRRVIAEVQSLDVSIHHRSTLLAASRRSSGFVLRMDHDGADGVVEATRVILATGRSGSGSIDQLVGSLGVPTRSQMPDLGVRLQMPTSASDIFVRAGEDTKLKATFGSHELRTFCVCSGGVGTEVEFGGIRYFDGHFSGSLAPSVNLGIMCRAPHLVGRRAALEFSKTLSALSYETYSLGDYRRLIATLAKNGGGGPFLTVLEAIQKFLAVLHSSGGIVGNSADCSVNLPAIDRYWPRVAVDEFFQTPCEGLYVTGDAAGVSRGYVQAMWSSYCAALHVLRASRNEDLVRVNYGEFLQPVFAAA